MNYRAAIFLLALLAIACDKALIRQEVENTPEANFEAFWQEFDRYYSYFELKAVDWQSVYDTYHPRARQAASPRELYDMLCEIVQLLKDGHVGLYAPFATCEYGFLESGLSNAPVHAGFYLSEIIEPNSTIFYGVIKAAPSIGYFRIRTFGGDESEYFPIDNILEIFHDKEAIIVDVRSNGGGSDSNSELIASRFATESRRYRRIRYRNGPAHGDFTEWTEDFIAPAGPRQFTRPVFLLTNRGCFSSTEDFILAMAVFDHVQTVGDTTGGGSGNPVYRELPNGWAYRLSTWQMQTADGNSFEGRGLPPAHLAIISREDSLAQRDPILEKAIELAQ